MNDPLSDLSDEQISRRLQDDLPRYTAPARLRAAILSALAPVPWRARLPWLAPALAATATALAFMLLLVPALPRLLPSDPVQRLAAAVASEHNRALLWGARRLDVIPAALPWLTRESGVSFRRVLVSDERIAFISAEPVFLLQRRGLALHYLADGRHLLTYVALPGQDLALPDRRRITIDHYRPALLHENGFSVWAWKHDTLVCFLVADLVSHDELQLFREYFLRIRAGTEPYVPS